MSTKISAATGTATLDDGYVMPLTTGGIAARNVTVGTLARYAAKYRANIGVMAVYGPDMEFTNGYICHRSTFSSTYKFRTRPVTRLQAFSRVSDEAGDVH